MAYGSVETYDNMIDVGFANILCMKDLLLAQALARFHTRTRADQKSLQPSDIIMDPS